MLVRSVGLPLTTPVQRQSAARPAQDAAPLDGVTLSNAPAPVEKPQPPSPRAALDSAQAATHETVWGAITGAVAGAARALTKPLTWVGQARQFANNFIGGMKTRAAEITNSPEKVEEQLKARGMHHEYQPPVNGVTTRLEGVMTVKATLGEFFELWASWIEQGYGSINDRQYADLIMKNRDLVKDNPLLKHLPMTSEDTYSVAIEGGKMKYMQETTIAKFGGVGPGSRVDWMWRRQGEDPRASNSFEKSVDNLKGDPAAISAFYESIFDPRRLNPNSTATVTFTCREVDSPDPPASPKEYEHGVHVPFVGRLFPGPVSTLDAVALHASGV